MNEHIEATRAQAWACKEPACEEGLITEYHRGHYPEMDQRYSQVTCGCFHGVIDEQPCAMCDHFVADTDKHGVTHLHGVICTECLEDEDNIIELYGIVPAQ
jgi:hypothetical protein